MSFVESVTSVELVILLGGSCFVAAVFAICWVQDMLLDRKINK